MLNSENILVTIIHIAKLVYHILENYAPKIWKNWMKNIFTRIETGCILSLVFKKTRREEW